MLENNGHSIFSPSKAHRYIRCPGSVALESQCKDKPSAYAREGTAAHNLAEMVLTRKIKSASEMLGRFIKWEEIGTPQQWEVDEDMVDHVQAYCDRVFERVEEFKLLPHVRSVKLHVEERVDFSGVVNIPGQFGTADVVIEVEFEDDTVLLSVEDLKYGMGVKVDAQDNEQLMTYGAGVMSAYELVGYDVVKVNLAIHQIRLGHLSEHEYSAQEIREFSRDLATQAQVANHNLQGYLSEELKVEDLVLNPGEKQCLFCKAKAVCPALRKEVAATVFDQTPVTPDEFEDMTQENITRMEGADEEEKMSWLSVCMNKIDMIEGWCKAIRGMTEDELHAGKAVPGWKLVEGKRGARQWKDKDEAENTLKSMRLKLQEMYSMTLISPAQAEKVLKESPRRWNRLQDLIKQSKGKPHVAPESDKRPALTVGSVSDDFDDLEVEDLV